MPRIDYETFPAEWAEALLQLFTVDLVEKGGWV